MDLLIRILEAAVETFLVASPWILLGLAAAGVMHVLLPTERIERWMGGTGFGAVLRAAAFGVPLPVCSCGVVPLALTVRRKGASRPATLSFLITTPESGVDSVALTWGVLGPIMAIARPVASLVTATIAGALAILVPGREPVAAAPADNCGACCDDEPSESPETGGTIRRASRYAFVTLLDDIAFWLVLGVALTGVVAVLLPADLAGRGSGIVQMLVILAAAIPIYVCASASTPVAAALVAKGVSPGAALVFLLAGPATNAASIVVLRKNLGPSFVGVYLASIVAGSIACGLALDALLAATGWTVVSRLFGDGAAHDTHGPWTVAAASILAVLLVWRLARGAAREGWREVRASFAALVPRRAPRDS